jgi:hypothetical protein
MNSARTKTGIAVNLHYVRTGRKGTPTILSGDQVKAMCKKFSHSQNGDMEDNAVVGKNSMGEMTEDYGHTRKFVSCHYNEVTEAIHNSLEKQNLEAELKECLNHFTVRAQGLQLVGSSITFQ